MSLEPRRPRYIGHARFLERLVSATDELADCADVAASQAEGSRAGRAAA